MSYSNNPYMMPFTRVIIHPARANSQSTAHTSQPPTNTHVTTEWITPPSSSSSSSSSIIHLPCQTPNASHTPPGSLSPFSSPTSSPTSSPAPSLTPDTQPDWATPISDGIIHPEGYTTQLAHPDAPLAPRADQTPLLATRSLSTPSPGTNTPGAMSLMSAGMQTCNEELDKVGVVEIVNRGTQTQTQKEMSCGPTPPPEVPSLPLTPPGGWNARVGDGNMSVEMSGGPTPRSEVPSPPLTPPGGWRSVKFAEEVTVIPCGTLQPNHAPTYRPPTPGPAKILDFGGGIKVPEDIARELSKDGTPPPPPSPPPNTPVKRLSREPSPPPPPSPLPNSPVRSRDNQPCPRLIMPIAASEQRNPTLEVYSSSSPSSCLSSSPQGSRSTVDSSPPFSPLWVEAKNLIDKFLASQEEETVEVPTNRLGTPPPEPVFPPRTVWTMDGKKNDEKGKVEEAGVQRNRPGTPPPEPVFPPPTVWTVGVKEVKGEVRKVLTPRMLASLHNITIPVRLDDHGKMRAGVQGGAGPRNGKVEASATGSDKTEAEQNAAIAKEVEKMVSGLTGRYNESVRAGQVETAWKRGQKALAFRDRAAKEAAMRRNAEEETTDGPPREITELSQIPDYYVHHFITSPKILGKHIGEDGCG